MSCSRRQPMLCTSVFLFVRSLCTSYVIWWASTDLWYNFLERFSQHVHWSYSDECRTDLHRRRRTVSAVVGSTGRSPLWSYVDVFSRLWVFTPGKGVSSVGTQSHLKATWGFLVLISKLQHLYFPRTFNFLEGWSERFTLTCYQHKIKHLKLFF